MATNPSRDTPKPDAGRSDQGFRRAAILAGLAALLPLVVLAGLLISAEADWLAGNDIDKAAVAYAGFVLVFVSAARFGQAMRVKGTAPAPSIAAILSLVVALAVLFVPERTALGALAAGLAAAGAWDVWSAERGRLPAWYGRLRLLTTAIAVPVLVGTIILMPAS